MNITHYNLHRVHLPLPRPIGDSQVRFVDHWMTVLELTTDTGHTGIGFELQQGMPLPALSELQAQFESNGWPGIELLTPYAVALRIKRPRGGNVGASALPIATETAAWDLVGKMVGMPLYKLFGGTQPRVPAYGSTLDFHLTDEQFRERLTDFRQMGFRAVKIKVGHPDTAWDLKRMSIVHDVMGKETTLMIDANEAWSPKEALIRAGLYHREGFDIFWIEDPISREDYAGYATLRNQIPFSRINTGEYLGFSGQRRLLESGGVDVLNLRPPISAMRAAAHLAGDFGIPTAMGNTILEIGVHVAASLPECVYLEYSDLPWNQLALEPVAFKDGWAIAPDRPGHGIELNRDALAR